MLNNTLNEQVFQSFPKLSSERLLYRAFEKKEATDFFSIRSNDKVMQYMDMPPLSSAEEAVNSIIENQQLYLEKKGISWAIVEKASNCLVGYFSFWKLHRHHARAEIGFALKPEYWGKGYMKETMDCLMPFAFNDLNIHSIEANIKPLNQRSENLLVQVGFQKEGYFRENFWFNGAFHDSIIYSLLEKDL